MLETLRLRSLYPCSVARSVLNIAGLFSCFVYLAEVAATEIVVDQLGPPGRQVLEDDNIYGSQTEVVTYVTKREAPVLVQIGNAIPLFYTYKTTELAREDTESYTAAKEFLKALKSFGEVLDPADASRKLLIGAQPASIAPTIVNGVDLTAWRKKLESFQDATETLMQHIDTLVGSDFSDAAVNSVLPLIPALRQKLNILEVQKFLDNREKILSAERGAIVGGAKLSITGAVICNTVSLTSILWDQPGNNCNVASANQKASLKTDLYVFTTYDRHAAQIELIFKLAAKVIDKRHHIPSTQTVVSIPYDSTQTGKTTLHASEDSTFGPLLSSAATKWQGANKLESRTIEVRPKELVEIRIAVGALYSFVDDPAFSLEDRDGSPTIVQSGDDFKELEAAVGLNIYPQILFREDYQIKPFAQFGVIPTDDDIGFFAGLGLQAYRQWSVSAGAVFQRVESLDGQAVGDILEPDTVVKTENDFETGFYVMLNFEF